MEGKRKGRVGGNKEEEEELGMTEGWPPAFTRYLPVGGMLRGRGRRPGLGIPGHLGLPSFELRERTIP